MKLVVYALGGVLSLSMARNAHAQGRPEPTPEQVQAAAEAFDHGRDAYKAGRYGEAAEQFERADSNAPSATALELAIKARDKAGDLDRAATLALLAVELYASEVQSEETGLGKIAPPLLERARKELYELDVQCSEPCQLVDGKKLVHGEPVAQRVIFLSDGQHDLVAGWSEGRTQTKSVTATAGASGEVAFEAPPVPAGEPEAKPEVAAAKPSEAPVDEGPKKSGGWSPTVFFVGAGLTVAAAGVTVWSGIDTKNNPGAERVKNECAAGDTNCELYKEGRSKQLRTNVLIGVTGALAVGTALIGALAVDWGGKPAETSAKVETRTLYPTAEWQAGPRLGVRGTF
ncbi:MAG TPA: hypothetical protein VF103_15935 [Polyangiaceae bacterium]